MKQQKTLRETKSMEELCTVDTAESWHDVWVIELYHYDLVDMSFALK